MDSLPAPQALNNSSTNRQSEEDTPFTSSRCFPLLRLPLEIQLLVYRHALTRQGSVTLQISHGPQTQETATALVSQPNSPGSVVSRLSDVVYNASDSNVESGEIHSQSVNTTNEMDTVSVQRYPIVSLNYSKSTIAF